MNDGDDVAIFEALSTPQFIAGCERRWFVLWASIAAFMGGPAAVFVGRFWLLPVAVLVFVAAVAFGAWRSAADPQFRDVHAEACFYEAVYPAVSRVDMKPLPPRRWL